MRARIYLKIRKNANKRPEGLLNFFFYPGVS